jgi:CHAT domain-containing protein/cytochrome c-type biogenesis protein CcmH/NrfG
LFVLCPFFTGGMSAPASAADGDGSKGAASLECCRDEAFDVLVKALEAGEIAVEPVRPVSSDFESLGKAYFYLNRWEEALGAFRKAAELSPHAPVIRFFIATTLFKIGRYKEALLEYRMLANTEPDDGYILFSLASTLRRLGREEEAIEAFERAAPLLPRSIFTDLVTKAAFAEIKDRQKAADGIKRIAGRRSSSDASPPPTSKPGMLEARCLSAMAYEHEIGARKNPEAYSRLGVMYGFIQQYRKAAGAFRRATELRSDYLDAYLLLGYTYGKDGLRQYGESIEAYRQGLALKPGSMECLYGIGAGYRGLGKHKEAVETLDRAARTAPGDPMLLMIGYEYEALKEYERASNIFGKIVALDPGDYLAWSSLGRSYMGLRRYERAVDSFEKAISLRPDQYIRYAELGWAYYHLRRFAEAAVAFDKAVKIEPRDPAGYHSLGLAYLELGHYDHAIPMFEKGLLLSPGNPQLFGSLALTHFSRGDYDQTIEMCRNELMKRPDCAECFLWIGASYGYLGNYREAMRYYENGLACCRKNNNRVDEAGILLKMANLNMSSRQDVFAGRNLERAAAIFREQGMKFQEGLALLRLGSLWGSLGNPGAASGCYRRALPLFEETNQQKFVIDAYSGLIRSSSDHAERLHHIELAIDFAARHNLEKPKDALSAWKAILQGPAGQPLGSQAVSTFADALRASLENSNDVFDRANASFAAGLALALSGQDDSAEAQLEIAYHMAKKANDLGLKVHSLHWLAILAFRRFDLKTATDRYCEAVEDIERVKGVSQSLNAKLSTAKIGQEIFIETVRTFGLSGNGEAAFNYVERARGSELLDLVRERVGASTKDLDFVKQERFLRLRAFSIEQEVSELGEADNGKGRRRLAILKAELRKVRDEQALLLQRTERENPELSSFFVTSAITMKETQAILDPDTTLLDYFIAGPQVFLWIVDKSSFKMMELPTSRADLEAKIETYREKLKRLRPDYEREAEELFNLLVRPAKPYIKTRTIGIVPHGRLHYLPFQALLDVEKRGGKTEKRFLIEEYDIFYTPSASTLRYTYEKRKPVKGRILAFGNPDLGNKDMDLPYAERELAEIRRSFPDAEIYLRKDATKSRASKLSSDFNVIHFASHAEMDAKNPLSSSIRMAGSGGNDDGKLTVGEVFGLDLRSASLVTLSACETGLGELRGGDEMIGLTRAFIYAGTPSIVASLWSVNDESTSRLMALFYSNLRSFPKAEALRRAQLEMIGGETGKGVVRGVGGVTVRPKTPGTSQKTARTINGSHPFFWAPFILIGDWK